MVPTTLPRAPPASVSAIVHSPGWSDCAPVPFHAPWNDSPIDEVRLVCTATVQAGRRQTKASRAARRMGPRGCGGFGGMATSLSFGAAADKDSVARPTALPVSGPRDRFRASSAPLQPAARMPVEKPAKSRPRLYLIDGYALIYRAFFALVSRPLVSGKGENTSAAWGVTRFLIKVIEKH